MERHGLVCEGDKSRLFKLRLKALFRSTRHQAYRRAGVPILRGVRRFHGYIIGPRAATANPDPLPQPHQAIIGRAQRHRQLRLRISELDRLPACPGLPLEPALDRLPQARPQRRGNQRPAVEQQKIRKNSTPAGFRLQKCLEALPERREMAGDGGLVHIGQPKLR